MSTDLLPRSPARPGASASTVLAVVCVAQFVLQLDFSIVNVALPSIKHDVGFTAAGLQWLVTGFALTFGSLLLFGGRAGDLFGQRRVLMAGLVVFGVGSVLSGIANDAVTLVAARVLQGIGGALMSPSALATLTQTFDDGAARVRALGVWQAATAAGATTGVLAGGALVEFVGWRAIFLVNVPIVVALLVLVPRVIPPRTAAAAGSLQLIPSVLVTFAIGALITALNQSEQHGFLSTPAIVGFVGTAVFGVAFFWFEHGRGDKLISPTLLSSTQRRGALGALLIGGAVLTAYVYFTSIYLQTILQLSPLMTGLALLPGTVLNILLSSLLTRRIIARIGVRVTTVTGLLFMAGGQAWFSTIRDHGDYIHNVLPAALITSLGLGLTLPTLTVAATAGVVKKLQGTGASLVATAQSVGSAIGLAVLATIAGTASARHEGSVTVGYSDAFLTSVALIIVAAGLVYFTFSDHRHAHTGAAASAPLQ